MSGIYVKSINGNSYYYNDDTGFIELCKKPLNREEKEVWGEIEPVSIKEVTSRQVEEALFEGISFYQLTFEVSTQCNMRCKYCYYGDHYDETREHGHQKMKADTAKKAIDYYMMLIKKALEKNPFKRPTLGFYGGEPLLNFQLIKEVVHYIEEQYWEIDVQYQITTNGLLLKGEASEFLVKKGFLIAVSLDGDKENHDRNRIKINGKGTFDEVNTNLGDFLSKYPDYENIFIMSCMDFGTHLQQLYKFFQRYPLYIGKIGFVSSKDTTYYNRFSDDDKKVFREEMNQLEELFKDKVKDNQIEELAKGLLLPLFGMGYFLFQLHSVGDRVKNRVLPYTSACIPGNRLFIDVKGNFHMCEKANQHFAIGDLDTGLDHNKIQDIINRYNSQLTNCHRCPISRLCDFCYVSLMKEKNFVLERQTCQDKIKDIKELLKNYVDMMEQSPQAMHKLMGDIEATLVNTHKKMGLC